MATASEVQVGLLLGRRVHVAEGQDVGRLEEIRATAEGGRCVVSEYVTGTRGTFERLSSRRLGAYVLRLIGVGAGHGGVTVPAALMDLRDPLRPRLTCAVRDLPALAARVRATRESRPR
jgi:hypothetical protein